MNRIIILVSVLMVSSVYNQVLLKDGYKLMQPPDEISSGYVLGNGIVDIKIKDVSVWTGTG